MSIRVERLGDANADDYRHVLKTAPHVLLHSSLTYLAFLERVLVAAHPHYFIAYENERPVGILPAIVGANPRYGPVVNSLPFYGSNGGVTTSADARDVVAVYGALLGALDDLATSVHAVASTVISNPLDDSTTFYESRGAHTFRDERIGQVTSLPPAEGDVAAALMGMFHQKTRNAIRKAEKSAIAFGHEDTLTALRALAELHRQNVEAVGGRAKPWQVFAAIRETFAYDHDYRVYTAEYEGQVVAALLVFFHQKTAEYFTPATAEAFRSLQPMSLLAHRAMEEAVQRGCTHWNWGGTWRSQHGVYQFKSRWGTRDLPYYYYTRLFDRDLLRLTPTELLREYEFFYVLPFDELTGVEHASE
jgi:GNAT acetyltransferase-like protein